ncbi:MAG: DsbE family thiol:disulfide interchange protein [Geminicoccaceae bacterium]
MTDTASTSPARRRPILFILPLALFALVGGFLALGLTRDPATLPSALLGKPVPAFQLPPLPGRDERGLASGDVGGQPMLVNFFASWCVPCRIEQPVLDGLRERGVVIQGINYKDKPADAAAWLAELGDPFQHIGADRDGRVGIEFGVYGVPETYVVGKDGRIAHRFVGPLQPRDVAETILPLLEKLR